jgi:hypothetical protein
MGRKLITVPHSKKFGALQHALQAQDTINGVTVFQVSSFNTLLGAKALFRIRDPFVYLFYSIVLSY